MHYYFRESGFIMKAHRKELVMDPPTVDCLFDCLVEPQIPQSDLLKGVDILSNLQ